MGKRLTKAELDKRLVELRNLRRLYARAIEVKADLRAEVASLKIQNKDLKACLNQQALQIAQLQSLVFGRQRNKPIIPPPKNKLSKTRSKASFRRPLPDKDLVTKTTKLDLPPRCACGGSFKNISWHERYEEDIPLPDLGDNYMAKIVTKQAVARGVCQRCLKTTTGISHNGKPYQLQGQRVRLGDNVRLLVSHLACLGLSYSQIIDLLKSLYKLTISSGEIGAILENQKLKWFKDYQALQTSIRASPALHIDETSWPIQNINGQGWAWVLSSATSNDVCYHLAPSRGVRVAKSLLKNFTGIRISDNYGAYRALEGQQQLCWAHLYRNIRELRYNSNLLAINKPFIAQWYEEFASIYARLRQYLDQPFNVDDRTIQAEELHQRLLKLLEIKIPNQSQLNKLSKLQAQLLRAGKDRLFTCLIANTACDNNKAERDLRSLVIKRKRAFGSKTQKGASALGVIMSLCKTTQRNNPNSYFKILAQLG